jgi:hypothetical protein
VLSLAKATSPQQEGSWPDRRAKQQARKTPTGLTQPAQEIGQLAS